MRQTRGPASVYTLSGRCLAGRSRDPSALGCTDLLHSASTVLTRATLVPQKRKQFLVLLCHWRRIFHRQKLRILVDFCLKHTNLFEGRKLIIICESGPLRPIYFNATGIDLYVSPLLAPGDPAYFRDYSYLQTRAGGQTNCQRCHSK